MHTCDGDDFGVHARNVLVVTHDVAKNVAAREPTSDGAAPHRENG